MGRAIGIDLGTSGCRVAVFDGSTSRLLTNPLGEATVPSVVALGDDEPMVGVRAQRRALSEPERTVFSVLRLLGRKYHAPDVEWLRDSYAHRIVAGPQGDAVIRVHGQDYSAEEVTSYLLEYLRRLAETELGATVDAAVIAVPACFDDRQRRAVCAASRLAGLRPLSLVNAPTAAALALARGPDAPGRMALLDVGAGAFDAALIETSGARVRVLAAAGDSLLGGDDIDRRIVESWLAMLHEQTGRDLSGEPTVIQRLRDAAVAAKHELSEAPRSSRIELPHITQRDGAGFDFRHPGLTRAELAELIADEVASFVGPCNAVFEDAGLGIDDLDALIVLGGTCRVHAIRDALATMFGQPVHGVAERDALVAQGAALLAAAARGDVAAGVADVCARTVGVKVPGEQVVPVFPRGAAVPGRQVHMLRTARDGQRRVLFELYEGDEPLARDNRFIGRFELDVVGDRDRFEVAFSLDPSGMLHLTLDPGSADERAVALDAAGGLPERDILEMRARRVATSSPTETDLTGAPTLPGAHLDEVRRHMDAPPASPTSTRRPAAARRSSLPPSSGQPPTTIPATTNPPPLPREARPSHPPSPQAELPPMGDDSLVGTTIDGRYHIESILGAGGMGRVYLARHNILHKQLALKVLHPELVQNRSLAQRFIREAQAASSIVSDHVVAIFDFGVMPGGATYFVMEHLAGETLHDRIRASGALLPEEVATFGAHIARGLQAAHDKGIIHRDLKPDNVVITSGPGGRPVCKILDFGIAKSPTSDTTEQLTRIGAAMGTPPYMAPEQIDGTAVDARCDVYALGVVLYEMATGRVPFISRSAVQIFAMHRWQAPVPVRQTRYGQACSAALAQVIHRCLAKDPADRFPTAADVGVALEAETPPPQH